MSAAIDRLCFALDYPTLDDAVAAARSVREHVGVFKVGLQLFVQEGPRAVTELKALGRRVFLDLKLHDIPATVAGAVRSAAALEVDYLTLHAGGGRSMLAAAAEHAPAGLQLLAVTVLTSMDAAELSEVGVAATPDAQVLRLAALAQKSRVGGMVCSVSDVGALRAAHGAGLQLVTPGVRPAGAAVGDQRRVGTPAGAIAVGSDLLVVGRPIRDASDPAAAAAAIVDEISQALPHGA